MQKNNLLCPSIFFYCIFCFSLLITKSYGNIYEKKWITKSQSDITNTTPAMLTSNYWLADWEALHGKGSGDKIISPEVISNFNAYNEKKGWVLRVHHSSPTLSSKLISDYLEEDISRLRRHIKYDRAGHRHRDPQFSEKTIADTGLIALKTQGRITVRYAFVYDGANMMMLPGEPFYSRHPKEKELNIVQNTYLSANTLVAIYTLSSDGNYGYAQSPYARGWVPLKKLAFTSLENAENYLKQSQSVVLSKNATLESIYTTMATPYPQTIEIPMGTSLKPGEREGEFLMPIPNSRNNNDLKLGTFRLKEGKIEKPLPLNRKNVLRQLFAQLGTPYSWGGSKGASDCSLLFMQVFRSFGLKLPRSSALQSKAILGFFTEQKNSPNLIELLHIKAPSHIMFYLGTVDGQEYVIHNTWGMNENENNAYFLKQVVVSPLTMGDGRSLGSLSDRITQRATIYR